MNKRTIEQSNKDLEEFNLIFEKIIDFSRSKFDKKEKDVNERFTTCLNYNLNGGKKYRALFVVKCFKELNSECTEEQLEKARLLGWCVELFQSYFLIHDDIMDSSFTRRGQLCWYRKVGLNAINDANYFQNLNFEILKSFFSDTKCYLAIVELFLNMYRNTVVGQCFDLLTSDSSKGINFDSFTMERYKKIITYKTAYYTFSLPIRCALYLAGIDDIEIHKDVENIMLRIGQLFQIQDDYLDLYGDPALTGKIGTDIIEGKCSWLIVNAIQLSNENELEIIKENYGECDKVSIGKIKKLYDRLRLKQLFFNLEENSYRELNEMIIKLAKKTNLPESALNFCLNEIYKRVK